MIEFVSNLLIFFMSFGMYCLGRYAARFDWQVKAAKEEFLVHRRLSEAIIQYVKDHEIGQDSIIESYIKGGKLYLKEVRVNEGT